MIINLNNVPFTAAILLGTFLLDKSLRDPNPPTQKTSFNPQKRDFLMGVGRFIGPATYPSLFSAIGIYHALLCLLSPPEQVAVCPNYQGEANPDVFHWNVYTAVTLSALCLFSLLRIRSFSNLGASFTFHLTQPQRLVTTGVHRYIRHPSYTANLVSCLSLVLLFFQPQGVIGCWAEKGSIVTRGVSCMMLVWAGLVLPLWFVIRVREEENMLHGIFGQEWEEYCKKTKRFIPMLF